jgi:hypothetical protein
MCEHEDESNLPVSSREGWEMQGEVESVVVSTPCVSAGKSTKDVWAFF